MSEPPPETLTDEYVMAKIPGATAKTTMVMIDRVVYARESPTSWRLLDNGS